MKEEVLKMIATPMQYALVMERAQENKKLYKTSIETSIKITFKALM